VGGIVSEDTLVSVGNDSRSYIGEMFPPDSYGNGSVAQFDYPTDYSMRAEFCDTVMSGVPDDWSGRPHMPLNIRLSNRSHVWREEPYSNFVLYDLVITNIGQEPINDGFLGLYCDADIQSLDNQYGYQDDLCGAIRPHGIFYGIDNDGDPVDGIYVDTVSTSRIFAVKFLETSFVAADTNFNWWNADSDIDEEFGPRQRGTDEHPFRDFGTGGLGVPEGDINKYHILGFPEWDYDQCYTSAMYLQPLDSTWLKPDPSLVNDLAGGADTRFVVSIGSFDLPPDSSVRIFYTTFTADSIHADPDNFRDYMPEWPYGYLAHLGLERLPAIADAAAEKASALLDPQLAPIGFHVQYADPDSVALEWDPWVFEGVHGCELRLTVVNPNPFPYPGVVPPWLHPEPAHITVDIDHPYRYVMTDLEPDKVYSARLAHRTNSGVGQFSSPIHVRSKPRPKPPTIAEYHFVPSGEQVELRWSAPPDQNVDHYNLYKFADSVDVKGRYLPFYDKGYMAEFIQPIDSFIIDSVTWYYYALAPYRQVDGSTTGIGDWTVDGEVYVVTSVDEYGFESEMTAVTTVNTVATSTKDVLVVTNSSAIADAFAPFDSIRSFYETVLSGLSYDIYSVGDSCPVHRYTCPSLRDIGAYRLVVVDDGLYDNVPFAEHETVARVFARYLKSGGKLAYFGAFSSFMYLQSNSPPIYRTADFPFIDTFFAIDSVFFVGWGYFLLNRLDKIDTSFGFNRAEAVQASFSDLLCDTLAYPMGTSWEHFWPINTPPSVAAFKVRDGGITTHLYRSLFPSSSMIEGEPVGVWTIGDDWETFLFGFHLYYMSEGDARDLVLRLLSLPTDVADTDDSALPGGYSLAQNYPNPFNPITTMEFSLPEASVVRLSIYNILGQEINTLLDRALAGGRHTVRWNGEDYRGQRVASGVYFYRLQAGRFVDIKKMLLLK
jgi:hypothetical protein